MLCPADLLPGSALYLAAHAVVQYKALTHLVFFT